MEKMPAPVESLGTESVMYVCHRLCASTWTGLRKPEPGFPQTSPHVPFSFVDSALYLFVITHPSHWFDYTGCCESSREPVRLMLVSGTLTTTVP